MISWARRATPANHDDTTQGGPAQHHRADQPCPLPLTCHRFSLGAHPVLSAQTTDATAQLLRLTQFHAGARRPCHQLAGLVLMHANLALADCLRVPFQALPEDVCGHRDQHRQCAAEESKFRRPLVIAIHAEIFSPPKPMPDLAMPVWAPVPRRLRLLRSLFWSRRTLAPEHLRVCIRARL